MSNEQQLREALTEFMSLDREILKDIYGFELVERAELALSQSSQPMPEAAAQGWKDSDTAKLVNDLRDVAVQFYASQQLRERIAHLVRPLADRLSASPAAPEGEKHPDEFICPLCFDDPANIKAAQPPHPQPQAQGEPLHDSDCSLHNEPAYPAGPCDCSVSKVQGEPSGLPYGIIDPDYARVYTQARIVAWQYGYACVMHGSFTRDLDLLLVPWTEQAGDNHEQMLKLIADACGLRFRDGQEEVYKSVADWTEKPHGRKACSLFFRAFGDRRWVDFSVMSTQYHREAIAKRDAALLEDGKAGGEVVAWQGRFLDMSDESSGWSSWGNIDPVDVEGWKRRCAQSDAYQMRPLYTRPQPAAQVAQPLTRETAQFLAASYDARIINGEWIFPNAACLCGFARACIRHGIGKDQA